MNIRERIEATLSKRPHDRVPFVCLDQIVPRGDLEFSLRERGMGLVLPRSVVWSEHPHVEIEDQAQGDIETTTYHTPQGTLFQRHLRNLGALPDSACGVVDGLLSSPGDYAAMTAMAEDAIFHVDPSQANDTDFEIGADGVVRCEGPRAPYDLACEAYGCYRGAPQMRRELIRWAAEQESNAQAYSQLLEALGRQEEKRLEAVLDTKVQWVSLGRLDGLYGPARWREHVLPYYQEVVPRLHTAGKQVSLHAHAANLGAFKALIAETGVDLVEAITPPPAGDLTLADARQAWGAQTVIWVNLPDALLWWTPEAIEAYVVNLIKSDPHPEALMVGFTETGLLGIVDEESDAAYRRCLLAVADALDNVGQLA